MPRQRQDTPCDGAHIRTKQVAGGYVDTNAQDSRARCFDEKGELPRGDSREGGRRGHHDLTGSSLPPSANVQMPFLADSRESPRPRRAPKAAIAQSTHPTFRSEIKLAGPSELAMRPARSLKFFRPCHGALVAPCTSPGDYRQERERAAGTETDRQLTDAGARRVRVPELGAGPCLHIRPPPKMDG
ncbi:hypothetical protein MTO96_009946 [Rhipicephalus appendiculatus]